MFRKSLQDLVRGIRSNKKDPQEFLQKALADIKQELASRDVSVKATAVQKLTYVSSLTLVLLLVVVCKLRWFPMITVFLRPFDFLVNSCNSWASKWIGLPFQLSKL